MKGSTRQDQLKAIVHYMGRNDTVVQGLNGIISFINIQLSRYSDNQDNFYKSLKFYEEKIRNEIGYSNTLPFRKKKKYLTDLYLQIKTDLTFSVIEAIKLYDKQL